MALDLNDRTSNNNNLTNSGAIEVTTSLPFVESTSAADFESASSHYMSAVDSASLSLSTTGTVEFWAKFESLPANNSEMFAVVKHDSYLVVFYNNGGQMQLLATVHDGTNQDHYSWDFAYTTGVWYHIAVSFDTGQASATTFVAYKDGVSLGNGVGILTANIASMQNNTNPVLIGKKSDNTAYWDGVLDDIRIWNDVRTGSEIANNYQAELVGDEAGLVAYWPFENPFADDYSSNTNTLVIKGVAQSADTPFAASTVSADFELSESDHLSAADSASLSVTGDISIEGWFKFEQLPSTAGSNFFLVAKWRESDDQSSYQFYVKTTDQGVFAISQDGDGAGFTDYTDWTTTPDLIEAGDVGVWVHLAVTVDVSTKTAIFYKNGTVVTSVTGGTADADAIFDGTAPLQIGAYQGTASPTGFYDGLIDEVRIWDDIRSEAEIDANMSVELVGNEANLVAYYPFEALTPGSASVSPSLSPSASASKSASASSSASSSASGSQSLSPSTSLSPSASGSSSASASISASVSASVSPSISASPSTGFSQYTRGDEGSLPGTNNDLETTYTEAEETKISTRNGNRVSQTGTLEYIIHQFKSFVGSQTYGLIEWEGQTTLDPTESTVYLQIYNQNTNTWVTIDSDSTSDAEVDFELEGVVNDLTNYKDSGNVISCRVYQLAR